MISALFHSFGKLLSRFRSRFVSSFVPNEQICSARKESTVKECTRDARTRKRVAASFKNQQSQMKARALKAHSAECKDALMCKQATCFKPTPDKIVSEPYKVRRRRKTRIETIDRKKLS